MALQCINRRRFVGLASSLMAGVSLQNGTYGQDPARVNRPRATDGDERFEPNWEKRLTLTVGQKKGDLIGNTDKVVQAAIDYMARMGGGTVHILPGKYVFRNAVHLPSRIRLLGSGLDSIITKIPSRKVALSSDSDWYDQEITLQDAKGFEVGDGIVLRTKNPHNGGTDTIKRTLVARSGNRFKLNNGLRKNLWLSGKPTVSAVFPLLTSEYTSDVVIENITLDGDLKNNENLNGNYGGGIFLQDCNRYTIRKVTSRNYNGDGISFQICHDVVVENCHSHDNADLGLHPGSGSQRPILRNNVSERNGIGIFWCWGVKFGLAEHNTIDGNRNYGISIGHCDTDNVMRHNKVLNSGKIGVLFRNDTRGQDFWANRNTLEHNQIINSGADGGIAIDIKGKTKEVRITDNVIEETRKALQRTGIRIAAEAGKVHLVDNAIKGFAQSITDLRKS